MKEFITSDFEETQNLGEKIAQKINSGVLHHQEKEGCVLALQGDLGGGKTTFTQGLLKGLGAEGPYISPTFLIMKHYHIGNKRQETRNKKQGNREAITVENVYHIDAYRVGKDDILSLGWEEIISNPKNVIIVEWADRIKDIIPENAIWLEFEWMEEGKRKITIFSGIK